MGGFLFAFEAFSISLLVKFAFSGSGCSGVGPCLPGQCNAQIYVFLVMFLTVKFSLEHQLSNADISQVPEKVLEME